MRPEDLQRERACFALLRSLEARDAVLVDGYAVSAYGLPRFSVDVDLVLPGSTLRRFRPILKAAGLVRVREWRGGAAFAGCAERWSRGEGPMPVSVDLLVDGISDRVSGAAHSFAAVRRGATRRVVRGLGPSSEARALVAAPEVLIGLKLEAGRRVDLRDIAVLSGADWRLEGIVSFLRGVRTDVLREHVEALGRALGQREFQDSLKGVYMLDERAFTRYADRARALVLALRGALARIDAGAA